MSELGNTIRALRAKRGMSLQQVGNAAGITKAHVWELEKGTADNPSVSTLAGLGSALGVSAVELFRAAMK